MTQEERELLLKDLCARLPYGVKVYGNYRYSNGDEIVDDKKIKVLDLSALDWFVNGIDIKPYLRPMESMTEEEEREVRILWNEDFVGDNNWYHCYPKTTDFYLSHHLDFRNLIQKGLALPATEGMYK